MPTRRPPSLAKVRLARAVFGLGLLGVLAVLLTGPAYRFGYIDVSGIQTAFGIGTSAALAAIVGGLALALLLPVREYRSTLLSTAIVWLFRLVVLCVFGVTLMFLASRAVPSLGARTDSTKLLDLAGLGAVLAVVVGILLAVTQPAGTTRPGLLSALVGVALGVAAAYVPISWRIAADNLPRINDISTDTIHPPAFVALPSPRGNTGNGSDYPGPAVAAAQRAGYPDIRPLTLKASSADAFTHVERVARGFGWEIVAREPAQGRLEAVATTAWFGFKDDIIVRLTEVTGGTRIDIRSRSRVGISDLGANAARIRLFLARLQQPA
ncbi:DUF1499 domain-containing protein [Vineibacter terrae]|uniref:DUF1499 domain-containing protein n=1 Tax=Vineibacter terrae TaxID=2586908 RepID=A0A5C8PLA3_9HYPH|nr:DUF1499 domain-containing protein [Vineibacter terrae]TXL74407.1 DUF1499 domain-containing protein [Vineibacter terrae]